MRELLVNVAGWSAPEPVPDGWLIANAPRPITGQKRWEDDFRHGIFYSASPDSPDQRSSWTADDAWLITFITNDEIRDRVLAHIRDRGFYDTVEAIEADGITVAEVAAGMQLPYHEEPGRS